MLVVWELKRNVSVVHFKFRCNILISGKIIKEMPGSVASGTPCISGKIYTDNQHILFWMPFFFSSSFENRAVYKVMLNTVQPGRSRMTIRRMCIECYIPKATNTLSEYVILIAFPPQQWLHERASLFSFT